jgi:hypothetical protein
MGVFRRTNDSEQYEVPSVRDKEEGMLFEYAADNGSEKLTSSNNNPDLSAKYNIQRVLLTGQDGQFVLTRQDDASSYYIEFDSLPTGLTSHFQSCKGHSVEAPFTVAGNRISEFFELPSFQLREVSWFNHDDEVLIKAAFQYTQRGKHRTDHQFHISGWLLLDPRRTFAVREYEMTVRNTGSPPFSSQISGYVKYTGQLGLPHPTEVVSEMISKRSSNPSDLVRHTFRVKSWEYEQTPASEFTLAAYGLEEVGGKRNRHGTGLAYWAIGIAGLALVASLTLRHLGGRLRSRQLARD